MKQEATKKPKKLLWLWIGLAALVLVAGAVVGSILLLGGGKQPTGPVGGRPDLYWNLDKELYTKNSESGLSTREAGEDGVYRIRFAYNGEQVELPIVDKQLVNVIDTMDVMGLVKDADDVVVDVIAVEDIATPVTQSAYVQQVKDGKIIANSSIAMNGMQYTIELTDLTQIYDVSETAEVAGQIVDTSAFQAMDSISIYANDLEEVTHIYMTDHPAASAVYWRAYQMWNSTEKSTSRVPDENGVYSIDFCSDGEIVTLKCKDKSTVTAIDRKSPHSCHFGLLFDEEGYIVDIMDSGIGIRCAVAAERVEVLELDGNYFSGTQLIPSDSGLSYSATLPEDCIIYDASSAALREGRQGQQVDSLKLGDRICVWTDPMGTPVLVYIANRFPDCEPYYNLERKYDGTKKETTREPDWAGYYTFEMVKTGETGKKTVKTKDKELATFIDSISNRVVGLKIEDGVVKYAYIDDDVFGWTSVWGGFASQIQGPIVSLVSFSNPDSPTNVLMNAGYKAYDMTGKDVPYGTETTLRVGDVATVTRDVSYNGVSAYITRRMVGGDDNAYYNLDYQYNSTTKETKRVPDAEGYYVFTMAHKGKQVTVKTKNKELANNIDKSPVGDLVCIMRVENGIAYELYETAAAYGQVLRSGYRVKSVNSDGTFTVQTGTSSAEYVIKMADDCILYNVSTIYDSHRGERCYSVKPGDMVTTLADYRGNAKLIYVRQRSVDSIFVNKQRLYDSTKKVTLREPDADGYYWYELAVDGELKKFKTKSKDIASQVDAYSTPFGARVKGDEILNVTPAVYAGKARSTPANGWDVTSISKWSIDLQFNKVGYANTGEKKSVKLGSNVKVYDISPTAKNFGEKTELKKGDRIIAYADIEGNVCYIFVLFHDTRVKGSVGYCEHCNKEVKWLPWGGGPIDAYDAHYYLVGDIQYSGQSNIGNSTKSYEIVLDMNGKKFEAIGSRGFLIRYDDTLSIIDSVGGGSLAGTGIDGGNGGTLLLTTGGTLNLYSGTLSFVDSDSVAVKCGAVIYATAGKVNVYGGTISGGIVNTSEANIKYVLDNTAIPEAPEKPAPNLNVLGGNVYLSSATLNMYGGTIENGQAIRTYGYEWEYGKITNVAAQGGNVYAYKGVINLYEGAEIRNGYSNQHGGNVFLSTATLNMMGGKINGGECVNNGGNLFNQLASVVNVSGGVMENGTAGALGNNIYGAQDTGEIHLSGGNIIGDITLGSSKVVSVSGTAKASKISIKTGASQFAGTPVIGELALDKGVLIDINGLETGASIGINADGIFTTELESPADYMQFVHSTDTYKEIVTEGNALASSLVGGYFDNYNSIHTVAEKMTADGVFDQGGTVTAVCPVCGTEEQWIDISTVEKLSSIQTEGHYYLSEDIEGSRVGFYKNACVHLNGKNITNADRAIYVDATSMNEYATVNIMGEGVVTGAGAAHASIPRGVVDIAGSVNFFGGTYVSTSAQPTMTARGFNGTSIVNIYDGAEFSGVSANLLVAANGVNVYGGKFTSGTSKVDGKNANSLNIYGGEFTTKGQAIVASGAKGILSIAGGTFDGTVTVAADLRTFTVSGEPVIATLDLSSGKMATVQTLSGAAKIGINAMGAFTEKFDNAKAYLDAGYIVPAHAGIDITENGGVLYATVINDPSEIANTVHTVAEQMTADGVFDEGGIVTAVCPVCGTEEQWIDISTVEKLSSIKEEGHYYLSEDIEGTRVGFYKNACVHLNGKNITNVDRAIYVDATSKTEFATVNIMGEGVVTGAGAAHTSIPRGVVDIAGSVNFFGGTYVSTGDHPSMTARGFNGTSVVNIYDGAEFSGVSVNMLVASNGVNVYGGKFTSGTSMVDGRNANSLNIYGGTFNDDDLSLVAGGSKGILSISGGVINGKVSVVADLKSVTVSGAPVILNLDLTSGKKLTIGNLIGGEICIDAEGVFTDTLTNAAEIAPIFSAVDAAKEVAADNNVLVVRESAIAKANKVHELAEKMTDDGIFSGGGDVVANCPVCEAEVTWKDLNALTTPDTKYSAASGHYYLSSNLQRAARIDVTGATNKVCLHLNGFNIDSTDRVLYVDSGTVNVMGEGVVTGGYAHSTNKHIGSTIDSCGNVYLFGGTYMSTKDGPIVSSRANKPTVVAMYEGASIIRDASVPGLNVQVYDDADFVMYGGIISGGSRSGQNGGNVLVTTSGSKTSPVFTMYGGVIENGTADKGGNIYATGNTAIVNIFGGIINNGDVYAEESVNTLAVAGKAVISDLDLSSGKKLTVSYLKTGANVTVTAADGAFTEVTSLAKKYVAFFNAAANDKQVVAEGNVLIITDK